MNVLLLCAGNTCRSPMAEGILLKKIVDRNVVGVFVRSCGVIAVDGTPANPKAISACKRHGIDIKGFRSTLVTDELINWADAVVCMTPNLIAQVKTKKVADFSLLYGIPPISDPYGGTDEDYENTFISLDYACDLLLADAVSGKLKSKINNLPYGR